MRSRLRVFVLICVLPATTACTAIVLGKVGDYKEGDPNAPKTSGEGGNTTPGQTTDPNGNATDQCSLLYPRFGEGPYAPANECSDCINNSCAPDVSTACSNGTSEQPDRQTWFLPMLNCAQQPWIAYPPPKSNESSYPCAQSYQDAGKALNDGTLLAKQRAAEICISNNCMQTATPHCALCDPYYTTPDTDEIHYLHDDPCGKCISDNCKPALVRCCKTPAMQDFIEKCSYTADNLDDCRKLADYATDIDAGGRNSQYDADDLACLGDLAKCYADNCDGKGDCK